MKLQNGAVEFYDIKQDSQVHDFDLNIPFEEYLYEEQLGEDYISILSFGADEKADYKVNTKAINSAIEFVSSKQQGTVYVPKGVFECSTIMLKSNVRLFVEGTLLCIDYEKNKQSESKLDGGNNYIVSSKVRNGFIFCENSDNITICGGGRIAGSGASYCMQAKTPERLLPLEKFHLKTYIMQFRNRIRFEKQNSGRVNLVEFRNCKGIDIHNIELYETAAWTCNLYCCNDIVIKDVVINSNYHVANSDGFDLSCCSNATIKHCYIATGDDALCIKADGEQDIENILIEDCKAMSLANCFKVGTTVYRNVKNVTVRNCTFFMDGTTGGYSGISIQSDCGGQVSDIVCENIKMYGITSAFLLWLGDRNSITPGELKNITIKNIECFGVSIPSCITGVIHKGKEYKVENVLIDNVKVYYRDSEEDVYIRDSGVGYEAMLDYPEITRVSSIYTISHELSPYWELPVYGLFVRDAENVTVKNFECKPRSCNKRELSNLPL